MFSGKTMKNVTIMSEMIMASASLNRESNDKNYPKAILINHSFDVRDESKMGYSTHNPLLKNSLDFIHVCQVSELNSVNVTEYDIIGIDEAQFFEDLVKTVKKWVSSGKKVVVSGLCGDFKMKKFGNITDLIPFCDEAIELYSHCVICIKESRISGKPDIYTKAKFTHRLNGEKAQISVGGSAEYIPVCRYHHVKLNESKTDKFAE